MAYEFVRRADEKVMCRLDPEEKAVIAQVAQEVSDLIRADLGIASRPAAVQEAAGSEDPLTRLEAELATAWKEPSDSAVQRLFPDSSEDPQLAHDLRARGQADLVARTLEVLARVQRSIDAAGPVHAEIVLDGPDAEAWLAALSDMRIVLADRLGLRSDEDLDTLRMLRQVEVEADLPPVDDAAHPLHEEGRTMAGPDVVLAVYELLSWLQESLVDVLMDALDD